MRYLSNTSIPIGGHRRISPALIIRLQADRNYTRIHEANGESFLIATTLRLVEERLHPYGFLRITRGDVINTRYIQNIGPQGRMQLTNGTLITLSRRRLRMLQ